MRVTFAFIRIVLVVAITCLTTGCGSFLAHRLVQAPNTYPQWLGPTPCVDLEFAAKLLTNITSQYLTVGPPSARLRYRVVEPANYQTQVSSSNWMERGRMHFKFDFKISLTPAPFAQTNRLKGTVVLLHGYGIDHAAMAPWAFRLAQEGWRCVLVDLRGHGKSTGNRLYFGLEETQDLSQLLNALEDRHLVAQPVIAMGESFGAALALRWKLTEPRLDSVIAFAPYSELKSAVLNIRREFAHWVPECCLNIGLNHLPALLGTSLDDLNPSTWIQGRNLDVLYLAGELDQTVPPMDVWRLRSLSSENSRYILIRSANHAGLPYYFDALEGPVLEWLKARGQSRNSGKIPSPDLVDRVQHSTANKAELQP